MTVHVQNDVLEYIVAIAEILDAVLNCHTSINVVFCTSRTASKPLNKRGLEIQDRNDSGIL